MNSDDLLTIREAAAYLGLSEVTLRRWDREGKLRALRHPTNGYRLYRREALERCLSTFASSGDAIPPPSGQLIGRAAELTLLAARFAAGARMITIVGPPGVGKTRLARHALRTTLRHMGASWCCEVTEFRTESGLLGAIAATLRTTTDVLSPELLGRALSQQGDAVLLVDNAEQLERDARHALQGLLRSGPALRLLITSREPLGVQEESLLEVGPLRVPASHAVDESVLAAEATQLLLARVRSPAALLKQSRSLGALVRRLDGLPLALELVAPQLATCSPKQLLERLRSPLELTGDRERIGARHDSLRDAIDASWRMLSEPERVTLASCAVFVGGFTLEAAEAVLEAFPGTTVLALLTALRERSLLVMHPEADDRFMLYESIRLFASEKLSADLRAALEARHARHYLARAHHWGQTLDMRNDPDVWRRRAEDLGNLEAVFERRMAAARAGDNVAAHEALLAVLGLAGPLRARGRFAETLALLDMVEPLARAAGVDKRRLLEMNIVRVSALALFDPRRLQMQQLVELAGQCGDGRLEAAASACSIWPWRQMGRLEDALIAGDQAVQSCVAQGLVQLGAFARMELGRVQADLGRLSTARSNIEAAQTVFVRSGDRWAEGHTLTTLAQIHQARNEFEYAQRSFKAALRCFQDTRDMVYEAITEGLFGTLWHEAALSSQSNPARARNAYTRAISVLTIAQLPLRGLFHAGLGALEAAFGRFEKARSEMDTAAALLPQVAVPTYSIIMELLEGVLDQRRAMVGDAAATLTLVRRIEHARPYAERSLDVRTAIRLLEASGASLANRASPAALTVGPGARWMMLADRRLVSLDGRHVCRLLLDALVSARLVAPGMVLSSESLLAAGWPGERMLPSAAKTRLYSAIRTLRQLGLRDVLRHSADGYLLDPDISVVRGHHPSDRP